jgi:hypothetical protein
MAVLEGGYNTRRLGGDVEVAARTLAGAPAPEIACDLDPRWEQVFERWSHPLLER